MSNKPEDHEDSNENEEDNESSIDCTEAPVKLSDENSKAPNEASESSTSKTPPAPECTPSLESLQISAVPKNAQKILTGLPITFQFLNLGDQNAAVSSKDALPQSSQDQSSGGITPLTSEGYCKDVQTSLDSTDVDPKSTLKETALDTHAEFVKEKRKVSDSSPQNSQDLSSHEVMPASEDASKHSETPHDSPDVEPPDSFMSTESESSTNVAENQSDQKSKIISKSTSNEKVLQTHTAGSSTRKSERLERRKFLSDSIETEDISISTVRTAVNSVTRITNLAKKSPLQDFNLPTDLFFEVLEESNFPMIYLKRIDVHPEALERLRLEDSQKPKHSETEVEKHQKLRSPICFSTEAAIPSTSEGFSEEPPYSPDIKRSTTLKNTESESVGDVIGQKNKKSKNSPKSTLKKTATMDTTESTSRETRQSSKVGDSNFPGLERQMYQSEPDGSETRLFPIVHCMANMIKLGKKYCADSNTQFRKPMPLKQHLKRQTPLPREPDAKKSAGASKANKEATETSKKITVTSAAKTSSPVKASQKVRIQGTDKTETAKKITVSTTTTKTTPVKRSRVERIQAPNKETGTSEQITTTGTIKANSPEKQRKKSRIRTLEEENVRLTSNVASEEMSLPLVHEPNLSNSPRERERPESASIPESLESNLALDFSTNEDTRQLWEELIKLYFTIQALFIKMPTTGLDAAANAYFKPVRINPPGPSSRVDYSNELSSLRPLRLRSSSRYGRFESTAAMNERNIIARHNDHLNADGFRRIMQKEIAFKLRMAVSHLKLIPLDTDRNKLRIKENTAEGYKPFLHRVCLDGSQNILELQSFVDSFMKRYMLSSWESVAFSMWDKFGMLGRKILNVDMRMTELFDICNERFAHNNLLHLDLVRLSAEIKHTKIMYDHFMRYWNVLDLHRRSTKKTAEGNKGKLKKVLGSKKMTAYGRM